MNEVTIRMVEKPEVLSEKQVTTKEEAIDICIKQISDLSQEAVVVVNFDSTLIPLNYCIVSIGTPQNAICRPADVWKSAVLSNARYSIVIHNHPYPGDIVPTKEDVEMSMDLAVTGYKMGIMLWDFLICQGDMYMSFQNSCPEYINVEKILGENYDGQQYR